MAYYYTLAHMKSENWRRYAKFDISHIVCYILAMVGLILILLH